MNWINFKTRSGDYVKINPEHIQYWWATLGRDELGVYWSIAIKFVGDHMTQWCITDEEHSKL